jgi:thioredoxin 1
MSSRSRLAVLAAVAVAVVVVLVARDANRSRPPAAGGATAGSDRTGAIAPLPRLVDLGSDKCVPCKMMAPILEELAQDYSGSFRVEVIDVREDREAGGEYGIRVIPTQIFLDAGGVERWRHEGFLSKEAILEKWEELGVRLEPKRSADAGA